MTVNIITKSNKGCTIDECSNIIHARGLCGKHYRRNLIHGTTNSKEIKMKRPLNYGVGRNDADYYINSESGKLCKYYQTWNDMLKRCYSSNYQSKRPTYIGCKVVQEWHNFMTFRAWMVEQDWKDKHLDKDVLIPGNKVYSPETCCFVGPEINSLLIDHRAARGIHPQGVTYRKNEGKYRVTINIRGKQKSLGRFKSSEEAALVYGKAKASYIRDMAKTQTERIKNGLLKHADIYDKGEYK